MKEFFESSGGIVAVALLAIMMFHAVMSGLGVALDMIKDKTPTEVDNKAAALVHKAVDISKAVIDFLQGNRAHK